MRSFLITLKNLNLSRKPRVQIQIILEENIAFLKHFSIRPQQWNQRKNVTEANLKAEGESAHLRPSQAEEKLKAVRQQ